jgi:squalene synthase HpnC
VIATAQDAEATLPAAAAVMARAEGENFPVASRLLPRSVRAHLLAIYGFARLVDELGDETQGDRLAFLSWLEGELDAAYTATARHPLMRALSLTLAQCELPREPFLRLIEANRMDQSVTRYETWQQLERYCSLSANPVGELVLAVFGLASAERIALSDQVCTALQLVEHCQDVAEDLRRGRIYMPAEDMRRVGCSGQDLAAPHAGEHVKALVAFEVARTRRLLAGGAPLIGMLSGRQKLAVAAFLGGGFAAAQAIEDAGFDVLGGPPKASRQARLIATLAALAHRNGPRSGKARSRIGKAGPGRRRAGPRIGKAGPRRRRPRPRGGSAGG